ncbi:MAG: zinc ABC transporter substrate-binding protein [Campylobacteraceae bacterium]|nr:zinc ABC transporter substrate-binding protein [Campylobacteraceae bacterium]
MKRVIALLIISAFGLLAQSLNVTVSILPQKYFVEKIAQDKINVNVMVKAGVSPAIYEPQTSQMKLLSQSDVYFSIGVAFEKVWLAKFENANKNMKIVNINKGIKKLEMGEHHHEGEVSNKKSIDNKQEDALDPHVWLNPLLVKIQAKNIYETLRVLDEENKEFYFKNYTSFLKELDSLNQELKTILQSVEHKAFMVFHPSWGYFAKAYNLEQIAVEKEGKTPKPKELVKLIKQSKEHQIKIIFVSPQFSQKAASVIARSIKGTTLVIDPLAYEYKTNLIKTAKAIYNSYE